MQVLGTFQSRDAADAAKDHFIQDGFAVEDLIVMTNRAIPEPPDDAVVEAGTQGEGGFAEFEEKVGKAVLGILGKPNQVEGDGFEGEGLEGALLAVTVADEAGVARAKALLERHFAGDIEVSNENTGT